MSKYGHTLLRKIRSSYRVAAAALALTAIPLCLPAAAQQDEPIAAAGYVTVVYSPTSFEVDRKRINVSLRTNYGLLGKQATQVGNGTLHDAVQVGVYIQVIGPENHRTKSIEAATILLRNDADRKLSGFGVIDKVLSTSSEPVFRADGYVIRITPATNLTFAEELNSVADITTNTWLQYEGKRDTTGAIVATKATFIPGKPTRFKAVPVLEYTKLKINVPDSLHTSNQEKDPIASSETEENSSPDAAAKPTPEPENKKTRYSHTDTKFNVLDDQALQDRLYRIGMKVVPAYQKELPEESPFKIHFSFYAIDNKHYRSEVCNFEGAIMLSKPVIERLKTDDQLAAVLADGVAYNLQRQGARVISSNRAALGLQIAADIGAIAVPGLNIAAFVGLNVAGVRAYIAMEEQRSRVALSLMSDAGYDLMQAPEAWRLLAPKNLPKDRNSLKYPGASDYQLSIIHQQYQSARTEPAAVSALR